MLGLAFADTCIDSAMEWPVIFLGSVRGYIKTVFLNNSKILVNRVVWLFRGNLEGLRLGLIPVEQFLTIVPGRAADRPGCQFQLAAGGLMHDYQFQLAAGLT